MIDLRTDLRQRPLLKVQPTPRRIAAAAPFIPLAQAPTYPKTRPFGAGANFPDGGAR